jgi:hypothetical protein
MRLIGMVVAVAVGLTRQASAERLAACDFHFQVRPAAGVEPYRASSPLGLSACAASCAAQVRFCRSESGGCEDVPLLEMLPKRRLEALETAAGPFCTAWSRIDLRAGQRAGSRLTLRGRASFEEARRVVRKRLTARCRRALPVECRTDRLAPDGVYEVIPTTAWGTSIGRVRVDVERGIEVSIHSTALSHTQLRGRMRRDDAVELTGEDVSGGDALRKVSGVARFSEQEDGVAVAVMFEGTYHPPVSFTLFRPRGGTPAALGGRRRFLLEAGDTPGSVLELDLDLPSSGVATSPLGTERDAGGRIIARTEGGRCLVTPAGAIHCLLPYLPTVPTGDPPGSASLFFFGTLSAGDGGSGAGQYYVGSPPVILRSGAWTEASGPLATSAVPRAAAANSR